MTRKILITGGVGFVGTHLANRLIREGFDIVLFDNLSTGDIKNLPQSDKVTFYKGDIKNQKELLDACKDVTTIIHLAAIVSVQICEENPSLCYENNVIGTKNIFEVAKRLHIPKIIYASSAAVYGNLSSSSISEEDLTQPVSEYGKSKLEKETIAQKYSDSIDSIGLRFFNIYGPGLSTTNAYPSVLLAFFKKIKDDKPLVVFGKGDQTRDFVHVYDIVQALYACLISKDSGSKIYNVGSGISTPIITLAEQIQKINPSVKIKFEEQREFDIAKSCSSILKIKKELNFEPTHKILEDLEDLLNFYIK